MKIAVATDDKISIRKGHFGEGRYYLIYEILNGRIFAEELRPNPDVIEDKHQHANTEKVMELLNDCQIFMAQSMGRKAIKKLAENDIEVIISSVKEAEKAVQFYLDGQDDLFKYYDKEAEALLSCASRR
ncbi:hypothetical protein B6D60_09525 [candidate division KSB1 bacterium 4484_87]|nr:MAG: hypothetical protein B6D60_09525 [candidate division KSB1 bacterium 4484_87]